MFLPKTLKSKNENDRAKNESILGVIVYKNAILILGFNEISYQYFLFLQEHVCFSRLILFYKNKSK